MLEVNFIVISIIHEISVLIKISRILKYFLRSVVEFYFFSHQVMIRAEEDKNIKEQ